MVVLVPRQLRFTGMTGNVPYYGGRFPPAQAYAAAHPTAASPPPPSRAPDTGTSKPDPLEALEHLLEAGVVDDEEYERLRARITR